MLWGEPCGGKLLFWLWVCDFGVVGALPRVRRCAGPPLPGSATWGTHAALDLNRLGNDGGFDVAGPVHEAAEDPVELGEGGAAAMASLERKFPLTMRSKALRAAAGVWWKLARRVMLL